MLEDCWGVICLALILSLCSGRKKSQGKARVQEEVHRCEERSDCLLGWWLLRDSPLALAEVSLYPKKS